MAGDYRNIHGRQWGRGWRPYLLFPKVIFAGAAAGSLLTLLALLLSAPPPATLANWLEQDRLIRLSYARVFVPALVGALAFGAALLLLHGRVMLRMRWLRLKLALILICVPTLHLYMRGRALALHDALREPADLAAAGAIRQQLLAGTLVVLVFVLAVIFLGRIKPRLGQQYAKTR